MSEKFNFPQEKYLLVGKIAKAHGLRGEVKIHAFSDDAETLLHYEKLVLVPHGGQLSPPLKVEKGRFQGRSLVLKFESIDDRTKAEAIHGMGILVDKNDLHEVEDDEYYWYQFYGLPVRTSDGRELGKVKSIFFSGAQDIMIVKDGKKEYLIPILDDIIVEHNGEEIIISPPPGLLEINDDT